MTSAWYTSNSVYDSQNFNLRLSEGSTEDSSLQRFATSKRTKDDDDIIVISDSSSCSSSPEVTQSDAKSKSSSTSNVRSQEYRRLYFFETSSESEQERKSDSSWEAVRSGNEFSVQKKSKNKTVMQVNKVPTETSLISNDASSTSDRLFDALLASKDVLTNNKTATNSSVSHDRDHVIRPARFINDSQRHINRSPISSTEQVDSKLREKYNTEKTSKAIKPNCAIYNSPSVSSRHPTYNTPKQDSTGKIRLTKKDTHQILKNIKYTQVVYDTPREKKEEHVIIDESTDIEDDIMHPAISPTNYNRKVQHLNDSSDVVDSSLKNDILRTDLSEPSKPSIDVSKVMDSFRPLSEKKKKEIKKWLLMNCSDSQSDSSLNTIPPSTRNSNSGNSSLERLEQNYETPNNREKINKTRTDEKERTIVNSDKVVHSFLTRQTTLDQYLKKYKNNSAVCTPDNKPKPLPKAQTEKKTSTVVNTLETKKMDCADILEKLYGTSWRDKVDVLLPTEPRKTSDQPINRIVQTERKPVSKNQYHVIDSDLDKYRTSWRDKTNVLLPTTEPRKTSNQPINRIVQTERKPVSKNQYHVVDSDSDESDLVENDIKLNRGRNIQRKQKEMDSFINDESLSGSDIESLYHSALTNPTAFTSSTTKSMPVPASIKRLQVICDTDTEDEDDKSSSPKYLQGRKLSFSDDESSSTSEFDPGDYVPPKYIRNKDVAKKPISPKAAPKFESTMTKSVGYKSFLASLSDTVPMNNVHPHAKKYRLNYKKNKEELSKKLYELYNEKVFDNKLPRNMLLEWVVSLRKTAGKCYNRKSVKSFSGTVRSSRIVLATKILDTPDRLRDTLIHEMCHAAVWLIDGDQGGHGVFWKRWTNKAMKTFPELPPITRCHRYKIKTKFTYRCINCGYSFGRHSKSLDLERKRCGRCHGKFELLINKTTKSGTVQMQTPMREPTGFALYVKQNYNSVKKEKSNIKHADVMKLLGTGM
ncbi:PREDICTED: uncharacterized protein LOC105447960 isoform X2 [Wasmannia auropunctata]|uniref:uncharacterized protein LOC105447960 isoform X2 n=1 Tax=Wasmannia auropunctata TaxID=64793 RepID=UPI0005EDD1C7|nr:PREDICTED: uncharacterized protein LOC105447960 isoform X2 [Wasmannia auropunctata]